jgi:hypothetical protein
VKRKQYPSLVCWEGARTNDAVVLVKMARILGKPKVVTSEEVKLWRKYLLPVKHAPMPVQKQAVADWYHEMKLRGLSDAPRKKSKNFLRLQVHARSPN